MFCVSCGKEIPDDARVCGYCGALTEKGIQQGGTAQQGSAGAQGYNGGLQGNYSGAQFKPDNQFNVWAFLFGPLWAACMGMWDIAGAIIALCVILGVGSTVLSVITGGILAFVTAPASLLVLLVVAILLGKDANYYYRLFKQQNIWAYKAIMDPQLRRI